MTEAEDEAESVTVIFDSSSSVPFGCPNICDGFLCWDEAMFSTQVFKNCPSGRGLTKNKNASRICGYYAWLDKTGAESEQGWTNFTECFTPETKDLLERLHSGNNGEMKLQIAENTRIIEIIGLCVSLIALVTSVIIFSYFRILRNRRNRLHSHLFLAMIIQVGIRLILYFDQAYSRSANETKSHLGIESQYILCEIFYAFLEYGRTVMFMWMFLEGVNLHNLISVNVFNERRRNWRYICIGWLAPIPLIGVWAYAMFTYHSDRSCWYNYNLTPYFWILEGPRFAMLGINFLFLLNIMRVVFKKIKQSNSTELQQIRKAARAALLLSPLLGLMNFLNMLEAPLESDAIVFGIWSYTTHTLTSTQGIVLSILYCFMNNEVLSVMKRHFCRNRYQRGLQRQRRCRNRNVEYHSYIFKTCSDSSTTSSTRTSSMNIGKMKNKYNAAVSNNMPDLEETVT